MPRSKKGDEDEEPRKGPGNPNANPVKIHRDYVERRLSGGAPATPEAYARALEQWHQLPGAVSAPSTDVKGIDAQGPPEEEDGAQPKDAGPDPEER